MSIREFVFAAALLAAAAAVTYGIALIYQPAAWIIGGTLGAAWTWLLVAEVDE